MSVIIPSTFLYSKWSQDLAAFLGLCGEKYSHGLASNQVILDRGVPVSCEEFCLQLNLFCGHIVTIAESGKDSVLVPVITGNNRGDSFLCHLQQRARDIILDLELIEKNRVVSPSFTYDESLRLLDEGFIELGHLLGIPENSIQRALERRSSRCTEKTLSKKDGIRIAITGTPPITADALLGGRIRQILADLGADSAIPDLSDFSLSDYPKDFAHFTFDAFSRVQTEAAFNDSAYDGVIFLQAFLCGPCCNTPTDLSQQERSKPFLSLVLDQSKSSAGVGTRLEAFLDIVSAAKERTK